MNAMNELSGASADNWVAICPLTDLVPDTGELLRSCEPCRAGADNRDFLSGFMIGRLRLDPSVVPGAVRDRLLDGLDRHRLILEVQRARLLAGRWADPAGKFWKVVG